MKYQVRMLIDERPEVVSELFVHRGHMPLWEKGLSRVEDVEGTLFQENSVGFLVFTFGEHQMHMKTTVIKNRLPESIDIIYEVKGAWNYCHNTFLPQHHQTEWVMDVEFRFDEQQNMPESAFIEKTTESMRMFKTFIEHKKANA